MGRQRGAASTVFAKWPFSARGMRSPRESCLAPLVNFLPGESCTWRRGGNNSLSLSLFLRAQRAIFLAGGPFSSIFEPSVEPWRGSGNPNLTLARSGF